MDMDNDGDVWLPGCGMDGGLRLLLLQSLLIGPRFSNDLYTFVLSTIQIAKIWSAILQSG